jgi:hypothetical protein
MYSFHCPEPLMTEHRISMATTLNFCTKLLYLISKKGYIMNTVDATESNVFRCCRFEMIYER